MVATIKHYEPVQAPSPHFDIFAAFERLDTNRKLALCDRLFHNGNFAYFNMVQKLWPEANEVDSMKLERMLRVRIERSLQSN